MENTAVHPEFADHTVATPVVEKAAIQLGRTDSTNKDDIKVEVEAVEELDLYRPLKLYDSGVPEENILSARAVIVGILLGALVNASNLYLGELIFHHMRLSRPFV